jgi:hypothetical protein
VVPDRFLSLQGGVLITGTVNSLGPGNTPILTVLHCAGSSMRIRHAYSAAFIRAVFTKLSI